MAHFDQAQFVSCEDQLEPFTVFSNNNNAVGGGDGGGRLILFQLFNPACTATGVLLMVLPYRAYLQAKKKTNMEPEVIAYLMALVNIFYVNLHQHAFSKCFLDLNVSGTLHSIFLSLMIYEHGGGREVVQQKLLPALVNVSSSSLLKNWKNPTTTTNNNKNNFSSMSTSRGLAATAALVAILSPLLWNDPSSLQQFAAGLGDVAALTVVPLMGYLSWQQRQQQTDEHNNNGRNFWLWILACLGVKGTEFLVNIEREMICGMKNQSIARWFHAIVIHSDVWLLFWSVSECAFGLVAAKKECNNGTTTINSQSCIRKDTTASPPTSNKPWKLGWKPTFGGKKKTSI